MIVREMRLHRLDVQPYAINYKTGVTAPRD
jgi:hypothetical protein